MALGDKKSEDIFNKNTGGDKDGKTITSAKETEIKNRFDDGEHIEDTGMFENLAPALYAIQKVSEDVEELRRYLTQEQCFGKRKRSSNGGYIFKKNKRGVLYSGLC